jgi:hypothetical protein
MSVGIVLLDALVRMLPHASYNCRATTLPLASVVKEVLPKWSLCKKYSTLLVVGVVNCRIAINCDPAEAYSVVKE